MNSTSGWRKRWRQPTACGASTARNRPSNRDEYAQRVSSRDSQGRRGSFVALEQTYNAYKWSKIHEQDLDELALGFNNEVAPTEMEVSGTVFKLSGGLDAQYTEWREILQRIFALETGLRQRREVCYAAPMAGKDKDNDSFLNSLRKLTEQIAGGTFDFARNTANADSDVRRKLVAQCPDEQAGA
jgi:hypothetical protein